MAKVDLTLVGVVVGNLKDLGTNLSRFKVLVIRATKSGNAKELSLTPKILSIDVHDTASLSSKDKGYLASTGSKVVLHVSGEPGSLKTEIVSLTEGAHSSLDKLVEEVDELP